MINNIDDLKKLIHNPRLYYVLIPCVVALWPLWVGAVALHASKVRWDSQKARYDDAQKVMLSMLELDHERLNASKQVKGGEFSYYEVVDRVARSVNVNPADCKVQASAPMKAGGGQESRDADITLNKVDLTTFAKFLSAMQLQSANLQCTNLKLTKQKGALDTWQAYMRFKYFRG